MGRIYLVYDNTCGEIFAATRTWQTAAKRAWTIVEEEMAPDELLKYAQDNGYETIEQLKKEFFETDNLLGVNDFCIMSVPFYDE